MGFVSRFDEFHDLASNATGLNDFGSDDYHEALRRVLSAVDDYTAINDYGKQSFSQQIVGLLVGRLMVAKGLKENPEALSTPIHRPIFIIGMARTGTTVLHRILTQDQTIQSLPLWLAMMPMPRPPRDAWETSPVFQQVKGAMENTATFSEGAKEIHPMEPQLPDECRWAVDQSFWSATLCQMIDSRDYCDWYHQADSTFAYVQYKKALQLIANGDNRRWVLKCPSHLAGVDSILKVFPDACIVQTHREPVESMRSVANLTWQPRTLMEENPDQLEAGKKTLYDWSSSLNKMELDRRNLDEGRFFDVHINETRRDPIRTIERIFDYFDLPVTEEAHASWEKQISSDPNVGHMKKHTPPTFGLTREAVNEAVSDYYERYLALCAQKQVTVNADD